MSILTLNSNAYFMIAYLQVLFKFISGFMQKTDSVDIIYI